MPKIRIPEHAKVTEVGQKTGVETLKAKSVVSEGAFEELLRRQLAMKNRQKSIEQQIGTILDAVRSLTDRIAKRVGDSRNVKKIVHTAPSVIQSDTRASVALSVASSYVSSVSQQWISSWARRCVENVALKFTVD